MRESLNQIKIFRCAFCRTILFLLLFAVFANAEILPIKTYTSADGLIYEGVRKIYQDSRGFVWFCTPVGVSRFDGYQFTSYGMENGLAPNPTINDIIEDERGVYWLGTNGNGIYRFDPRANSENKFILYKISDENESANEINRFFKTRKGEVYVATFGGVYRLNDAVEKKFEPVDLKISDAENESFNVFALAEDAEDSLWIGHERGLTRRLPDGAMVHYAIQSAEKTDAVRSLSFDRQNRLWLVSENRNLLVYNPEPVGAIDTHAAAKRTLRFADSYTNQLRQGFAYQFKTETDGDFNTVRSTSDGRIWLGTRSKGLVEFDGVEFRVFNKANGLSDTRIAALLEDTFGNLWIASSWGAMRLSQKGFTTYNLQDGLANEIIFQTFQVVSGKIYVISPNWIVNEFDGKRFTAAAPNLPKDAEWKFARTLLDREGDWWFGTQTGLYRFGRVERIEELKTAAPKAVYKTENGLPSDKILDLFEDLWGNVWISFWYDKTAHLTRWERATDKFYNYSEADGFPPTCSAGFFDQDASGNVFAACSTENIVVYNRGRFITLTSPELKSGGNLHDIYIDSKSRVWVATSLSGLIKIESPLSENPRFTTYTTEQGLSSNHIQYVTEDNFGRIYYVTSRGMDRLEVEAGKIKYYTLADGLAAAGSGLAFRASDGNLWLGTYRGLSKFIPETIQANQPPPIFIGGVRVAGKPQPLSSLGETQVSDLTLESDQRQIQIDYYGLSLATGEALRYQYKLEGADTDWSQPSIERTANYPNIAPGNYRFLVRAVSADGSSSSSPSTVSFTVLRPVWQRWWFLILAALIIGFFIYALYRYRLKRLLELERVRTRIATDLHDDIGSSLSQIAILSEVVRQKVGGGNGANQPLNLIAETSREMVDSMSDIVWAINPDKDHLSDLIQRMRRFASDILDAKDIAYKFHFDEKHRDVSLGADIRREVYLIFKESINNLVKHAATKRVEIEIKIENNRLVVKITDDGKGFDVEKSLSNKQDSYGGNGLPNMIRRAENLGGEFVIESNVGHGTNSILTIPLGRQSSGKKTLKGAPLSIILFILLAFATAAQAERLPVRIYTSADGLGSSFVSYVMRDSHGFLWFCTRDGLSRYDGARFITYRIGAENSPPGIEQILETKSGIYWITTISGLYRYDPRKSAENKGTDGDRPTLNAEYINNQRGFLFEDSAGNLWISGDGLYRISERDGNFVLDKTEIKLPPDYPAPYNITNIAEGRDKSLWLVSNEGLLRLLPDGREIFYRVGNPLTNAATSVLEDATGKIWLVCVSEIYVLQPETLDEISGLGTMTIRRLDDAVQVPTQKQVALPEHSGELYKFADIPDFAGTGIAKFLYQTTDKHIWVSAGDGVVEFDGTKFKRHTNAQGILKGGGQMVEDDSGNLWFGWSTGVMRLDRDGLTTFDTADGLNSTASSLGVAALDGEIYTADSDFYICRFNGTRFQKARPNLPTSARAMWTSNPIFQDSAGEWWFLTIGKLYRFAATDDFTELARQKPLAEYDTRDGLKSDFMYRIYEDRERNIFISVRNGNQSGLSKWNRASKTFYTFSEKENFPSGKAVSAIAEDRDGSLWIGFYEGGLMRFRDGRFSEIVTDDAPKGLVTALHTDAKGRLWIATASSGVGGLENPTADSPQFTSYKTANGLSSNNARSITEDQFGQIYIGTARGIDRIAPDTGRIKHYSVNDGLAGDFVSSASRTKDGALWFGTPNGLSRLVPHEETKAAAPPVLLSALRIAGESQPIPDLGATEISNLELRPAQNNLQIDFFGVDFNPNESLLYQYKLEGADTDWSPPTEQRAVNYANLSAGNYRFLVRAIGADGSASANPAMVSFRILRPVWQRWWFLTLAAFVIAFFIYSIYRYRLRRLVELERVRTRIATDLHDDIGSSLSQIAILSEVVRQKVGGGNGANEPLNLIANTSREMVDSMSDIVWAINPDKDHLSDLVHRMRRFASDILDAKDIAYRFHFDEKHRDVGLGADIRREVYLIFKESVNNLVKYSEAKMVEMSAQIENNWLVVKVKDDGRGFTMAESSTARTGGFVSEKDYDGFGGNGLINMRRRTETLGGRFLIESQKGAGTSVEIKIPI